MRIAIATEVRAPQIDGISNRLTHPVRELVALGHEVLTITPRPAEPICVGEQLVRVPGVGSPLYPDLGVGARALAEHCSWRSETQGLVASFEFAIQRAEKRSLRVELRNFLEA